MKPFAKGALVPYLGQVVPIYSVKGSPEHGWVYCVRTKRGEMLDVHPDIPHAVLIANMGARARWAVDEYLVVQSHHVQIGQRKWSFKLGTVLYEVGDPRKKFPGKWLTQEQLFQLVHPEEAEPAFEQLTGGRTLRSTGSHNTFDNDVYRRKR